MKINIHKGLIYKYTQHKFEQYTKNDINLTNALKDEKKHLCEKVSKKAWIVLVLLIVPYFIVVNFAFYWLSVQGNFLALWFYRMIDEVYEIILYGDWGTGTPHKRVTILWIFIKLIPFIIVILIILIPVFLLDAALINRFLKSEINRLGHK